MENKDSLGIALLDIGNGFSIINECTEHEVAYGTFAITLINTDYEQLRKSITDLIHQYFDNEFQHNHIEKFTKSLYTKIHIQIGYASKGYMQTEQAHMVTELLVREILKKIEKEHFEVTDIEKFIPVIFSSTKIRNDIKDILTRKSNDLTPIMKKTKTFEINSQLLYMKMPVYYLNTICDYLLLDLKMYLERSDKTVKACERCERLYLPTRKSNKYCRLPIRGSKNTCNKIMHISPNDKFAKARNTARDKQHKQIRYYNNKNKYTEKFLLDLYDNWSKDCGQKYIAFKSQMDITGFYNWIKETAFTADKLKIEWENYQHNHQP